MEVLSLSLPLVLPSKLSAEPGMLAVAPRKQEATSKVHLV